MDQGFASLRGVSCVMSLCLFGGGFSTWPKFRGPTFIPNDQLRLGVCEKKSRFFSLWTIFSTKKIRNPSCSLVGSDCLSLEVLQQKPQLRGLIPWCPSQATPNSLSFFRTQFFQPRESFSIHDLSFPKFIPNTTGGFSEKHRHFQRRIRCRTPCRVTQCRSVVCAWGPLLSDAFRGFRRGGFRGGENVKIFKTTTELVIYYRKSQNHHETITLQKSKWYK